MRNAILATLDEVGPSIGVRPLARRFPGAPRAEIADLLRRYRRVYRRRCPRLGRRLRWLRPGTVWAVDHCVPPAPIDGVFPAVLAVWDLALGEPLLWQPLGDMSAAETERHLVRLFALHGPPLVLKSDNGSAFRAHSLRRMLARCGVTQLRSPPATPRYNGSVEAAIGALKRRTAHRAERGGTPGRWRSEHLGEALHATLECYGDPERAAPSRVELETMRQAFRTTLAAERRALENELAADPHAAIMTPGARERRAITRALVAHGLLEYRSERVSPPIRSASRAKIM